MVAIVVTHEISDNVFRLACPASSGASCHAIRLAGPGAVARTARVLSARRSWAVFAAFANVGYCHQYSATDYTHAVNKPSKKDEVSMTAAGARLAADQVNRGHSGLPNI